MKGMGYVIKQGLAIVLSVAMLFGGMELPVRAAENGADIVPEVVTEAEASASLMEEEMEAPEMLAEDIRPEAAAANEADAAAEEITTAVEVSATDATKMETADESVVEDIPDRLDAGANTGKIGTNGGITWTYDKATATLTLSGTDELTGGFDANIDPFSPLKELYSEQDIQKIIFKACTLTGSAQYLFEGMSDLREIDFSGINTSAVTNMWGMFEGCSSLSSLDLRNFNTSAVTNMVGMFDGCSGLTSLDLSSFDTSAVTNMGGMFFGCSGLTSLDLRNFNTSAVTYIVGMFQECSSLSSLDLRSFNTSAVTNMALMFDGCSSLTSLDLSSFDTSKVIRMEQMFQECSSLSSLDLRNFNTSAVGDMYRMFYGCSGLTSLDVSNFDTSNVVLMGSMFQYCSSLTSLDLSSFDTSNVIEIDEIDGDMDDMLSGCDHLSQLISPKTLGSHSLSLPDTATFYDESGKPWSSLPENTPSMLLTTIPPSVAYTVCFDNNLEGEEHSVKKQFIKHEAAGQKLFPNLFKRKGYSFVKWTTGADGTGTVYADEADVTDIAALGETITLYAQWEKKEDDPGSGSNPGGGTDPGSGSNPGGGTDPGSGTNPGGGTDPGSGTNPGGGTDPGSGSNPGSGTNPGSSPDPGSSPEPSGSPAPSESPTPSPSPAPTESPKPADAVSGTYRITYSLGGGTNVASNPASYNGTAAVKLADPTRTGYTFGGWYSDSALKIGISEIAAGSAGNQTFYAKWTANKYTITFDSNGGSGSMKAMTNRAYGTAYELSANKFKKAGSVFIGWANSAGGTEVAYRDCDRVKDLTAENGGSVTLYARWLDLAANNAYSLTYRLNGGANDPANPSYYTEGAAVTLKAPTKPGYSFDGWYAKSNLKGGKTESIDAGSKGNKTLYAKWTPLTYTIKFNGNPTGITQGNSKATSGAGGKVENSMADITNAKTGKKVTLKANKFKYNGYTFAGWNTKPDGSGVAVKNKAGVKDLCLGEDGAFKDTVTLYAQWTETKYAITYKLNKGKLPTVDDTTAPGAPSCPKSYTIGSDTITLAAPTRSGYTFDGWYTTKKCKDGTKVESIPAGSAKKITLYAKWVKNK